MRKDYQKSCVSIPKGPDEIMNGCSRARARVSLVREKRKVAAITLAFAGMHDKCDT